MTTGPVKPGRIETAVARMFMKSATVREYRVLTDQFRLVTLRGAGLRGVSWSPGQKIQIAMGGWAYRTYTPLSWDAERGETQLLVFLHGDGAHASTPGTSWGRALKEGDDCTLFGPRGSVDLDGLDRPALVFGDETSFGLAYALRHTAKGADGVRLVFEVNEKHAARTVLSELGLADADVVERTPDDAHASEVERIVVERVQALSLTSCALTGKAASIQRLNKRLRALGLTSGQVRTRAYWAPGKVGLD
jgi:ferric-chelate reductase (NADPH)